MMPVARRGQAEASSQQASGPRELPVNPPGQAWCFVGDPDMSLEQTIEGLGDPVLVGPAGCYPW